MNWVQVAPLDTERDNASQCWEGETVSLGTLSCCASPEASVYDSYAHQAQWQCPSPALSAALSQGNNSESGTTSMTLGDFVWIDFNAADEWPNRFATTADCLHVQRLPLPAADDDLPAKSGNVIFTSGSDTWVFRGNHDSLIRQVRDRGYIVENLRHNQNPQPGSKRKNEATPMFSQSGLQGSHHQLKRPRSQRNRPSTEQGSGATVADRKNGLREPRFSCPFAKHDPQRYEKVFNSCTAPPGFDGRHIKEHLRREHSAVEKCIFCGQRWTQTDDWENSLINHLESGQCVNPAGVLFKPECMTSEQERTYCRDTDVSDRHDENWISLYMSLFPGEFPIPDPHYDYYTARHKFITRNSLLSPVSDGSDMNSNGEDRVWFAFSRSEDSPTQQGVLDERGTTDPDCQEENASHSRPGEQEDRGEHVQTGPAGQTSSGGPSSSFRPASDEEPAFPEWDPLFTPESYFSSGGDLRDDENHVLQWLSQYPPAEAKDTIGLHGPGLDPS